MKALYLYEAFNWVAFANGKTFVVTDVRDYVDYETQKKLGKKVECVIASDKTAYPVSDGRTITNRYEKIVFKVTKDVDIPLESRVIPKNVVAKVYGRKVGDATIRDQLSVSCEDIEIVMPREK